MAKKTITAGKKHETNQLFKNVSSPNVRSIGKNSLAAGAAFSEKSSVHNYRDSGKNQFSSKMSSLSSTMHNFSTTAAVVTSKNFNSNHYGSSQTMVMNKSINRNHKSK